jgi:hypothetical protein
MIIDRTNFPDATFEDIWSGVVIFSSDEVEPTFWIALKALEAD